MKPLSLTRGGTLAVATIVVLAGRPVAAQSAGTLNHNGIEMSVKGVVAVWNPEMPSLKFHLLPFEPTPEEVALLQKNDKMWLLKKKSVDAKKWPMNPSGIISLDWSLKPQAAGDLAKAWPHVYAFHVGAPNSNLNFNLRDGELKGTLTGKIAAGEEVTFTTRGESSSGQDKLTWDLNISTKVLPAR